MNPLNIPEVRCIVQDGKKVVTVDGEVVAAKGGTKRYEHVRVIAVDYPEGLTYSVEFSNRTWESLRFQTFRGKLYRPEFLTNQLWRAVVPVEY